MNDDDKQNPNPSLNLPIPAVDTHSGEESGDESDSDFEFSIGSPAVDLVAAGDITYPVFNRRLLDRDPIDLRSESATSASSSPAIDSSTAAASAPSVRAKKSASTGSGSGSGSGSSSRRWSVKELVGGRRSHSDGKEKFVFMNSNSNSSSKAAKGGEGDPVTAQGSKTAKGEMDLVTAHRIFYGAKEKKGEKQGEKGKRSILPRTELVGLFANSRAHHHHPFNF